MVEDTKIRLGAVICVLLNTLNLLPRVQHESKWIYKQVKTLFCNTSEVVVSPFGCGTRASIDISR